MRILLITGTGKTRAITLFERRWTSFVVVAACVGFAAWLVWPRLVGGAAVDEDVLSVSALDQWRSRLAQDTGYLVSLQERVAVESDAQGRLLAQMQARLVRMEALGARIVESAALDADEFDFRSAPALGGPALDVAAGEAVGDVPMDIATDIESLAQRLRWREAELTILENVLVSRDMLAEQRPSGAPVARGWISSPFGTRVDPIHGRKAFHAGVDFVGRSNAEVLAAGSGVVTFAGDKDEYGQTVEISHGNGLTTRYGHHSELRVEVGDIVRRGDVIGIMGSTGRSKGHHVHFEVEQDGRHIDPAGFLKKERS